MKVPCRPDCHETTRNRDSSTLRVHPIKCRNWPSNSNIFCCAFCFCFRFAAVISEGNFADGAYFWAAQISKGVKLSRENAISNGFKQQLVFFSYCLYFQLLPRPYRFSPWILSPGHLIRFEHRNLNVMPHNNRASDVSAGSNMVLCIVILSFITSTFGFVTSRRTYELARWDWQPLVPRYLR